MGKRLVSALTLFLLLVPCSSAFGVSSRASSSNRQGLETRNRPQPLFLVVETTALVADAAVTVANAAATVATSDDGWQGFAKDIAQSNAVMTATVLFGFAPYLEKGIVGQTKEMFGELKTDLEILKTDVGSLKTDVGNLKANVGILNALMIAAAVVLVVSMMKTN